MNEKTAAVILNYNDGAETVSAAERLLFFDSIDKIIIVDNASTDDSAGLIREFAGRAPAGKLVFIEAESNGGYGRGNNLGVKKAAELDCGLALIANPDSFFGEELVLKMKAVFADKPGAAVIGAVRTCGSGNAGFSYDELLASGWKKRGLAGELINTFPVLKRLLKGCINYSRAYYESGDPVRVYAVHGSLLMVKTDAFLAAGGYDEEVFLYQEEYILAHRLEEKGCETWLLRQPYLHEGSHSITGSGHDAVRRQKLRQKSELVYYKKYLKAGAAGMAAVRLVHMITLAETKAGALAGLI